MPRPFAPEPGTDGIWGGGVFQNCPGGCDAIRGANRGSEEREERGPYHLLEEGASDLGPSALKPSGAWVPPIPSPFSQDTLLPPTSWLGWGDPHPAPPGPGCWVLQAHRGWETRVPTSPSAETDASRNPEPGWLCCLPGPGWKLQGMTSLLGLQRGHATAPLPSCWPLTRTGRACPPPAPAGLRGAHALGMLGGAQVGFPRHASQGPRPPTPQSTRSPVPWRGLGAVASGERGARIQA